MIDGNIYFLQVKPYGPVKIGWTSGSVYYRMKALQAASPYELKWIGAAIAKREAETIVLLLNHLDRESQK